MKALTWIEYLNQAEPVLLQVFNDPEISQFWCQPFASSIESQVLISPYKFTIEPPMTDALVAAAIAEGTKACYISGLWRSHQYSNDWYVPIDEFTRAYSGDEIQDALIWAPRKIARFAENSD